MTWEGPPLPPRLGDLLDDAGARLGMRATRTVGKVWANWSELVGADIAARTRPSSLKDGVLRIRADSPAWATEIGYHADTIKARVNELAGTSVVSEVVVWSGPPRRDEKGSTVGSGRDADRPAEENQHVPSESPEEALARAREAWAKRRAGRGARSARVRPEGTS
ncbi:MAG TPA: DUF721 domain-containing protein [Actinomycetota bacterium]|nr:DUF721 domain-containing protein [Actinomycetota bacterium]